VKDLERLVSFAPHQWLVSSQAICYNFSNVVGAKGSLAGTF